MTTVREIPWSQGDSVTFHLHEGGVPLPARPYLDILRRALQIACTRKQKHKLASAKLMLRFIATVTKSGLCLKHIDAALSGFVDKDDEAICQAVESHAKALLASQPDLQQDCSFRMMPRLSYDEKEQQTQQLYQAPSQGAQQGCHPRAWEAFCAFVTTVKKARAQELRQAFAAYQGIVWKHAEEMHELLKPIKPIEIALEHCAEEGKAKDTKAALHDAEMRASEIVPMLLVLDKYAGNLEPGARRLLRLTGQAYLDAYRGCQQKFEQQLPDAQDRARLRQLLLHFWHQFETMSPAAVIVAAQAIAHCCEDTLLIGITCNAAALVFTEAMQHHYWLSTAACASPASPYSIAPPCDTCCVHVHDQIRSLYA